MEDVAARARTERLTARQRAWRAANPEQAAAEVARGAARKRAQVRLAAEYPERFAELLAEETLPLYLP